MASFAVGVTIASGQPGSIKGYRPNSITAAQTAAVTADVGVLVADAGTPTQAHVNTLNTDWLALVAGQDASSDDVVMVVNTTNCTTLTALRRAMDRLYSYYAGLGALTP